MLSVLVTYSAINFIAGPLWAFCMIAYSLGFIHLIYKDMKLDLKKVKAFTMIEMIMVITIMAILLTITLGTMKADTSKAAIIQVGTNLKLYNAKAMAEQTTYRIEITTDKLEVYDIYSALVHEEDLKHAVTFDTTPSGAAITNESVVINYRGELENRTSGLKLWIKDRPLRVNMFTGKVSYYQ
jgi:prepilin-type N-terminal cleavage/methylation domain-containing protein